MPVFCFFLINSYQNSGLFVKQSRLSYRLRLFRNDLTAETAETAESEKREGSGDVGGQGG